MCVRQNTIYQRFHSGFTSLMAKLDLNRGTFFKQTDFHSQSACRILKMLHLKFIKIFAQTMFVVILKLLFQIIMIFSINFLLYRTLYCGNANKVIIKMK